MRTMMLMAMLGLSTACSAEPAPAATEAKAATVQTVTLTAKDGVTVFGDYYPAVRPKAVIVLFHQAGSSAGEYRTIAPRLAAAGYSALAIDQRSGGAMYGANRTVEKLGTSADYLAARADMQAALDWAVAKKLPVALWGSSYSSSLGFVLAAANPGKVAAVLAFSPGEYFDDKALVATTTRKVTVPVFVYTAPGEREEAAPIVRAVAAADRTIFLPDAGVHGSSTLIAAKNSAGADAAWPAVSGFLAKIFGSAR